MPKNHESPALSAKKSVKKCTIVLDTKPDEEESLLNERNKDSP